MGKINRSKRNHSFFVADKYAFNDPNLSWKAKGILGYILSKPDDWQTYVADLVNHAKDGRDSTSSGVKELIESGYVERKRVQGEDGRFEGYDYTFYERPIIDSEPEEETNDKYSESETVLPVSGFPVNGASVIGNGNTTKNEITKNEITNNFIMESFVETYPKLHKKLSKSKANLKWIQEIIDVVDYFREVSGRKRTSYHSQGPMMLMLRWLKEGYSVDDMKLVIDYKTWEFTYQNPNPDYIALDTFFRSNKFESNLDKAREWRDRVDGAEANTDERQVTKEVQSLYARAKAWYDTNPAGSHMEFTLADFNRYLNGEVDSGYVQQMAKVDNRSWLLNAFRSSVDDLFAKGWIAKCPPGHNLINLICKNIEIRYSQTR